MHASRTFALPAFRIASLSGRFASVSSSTATVISRSSYVSSLRSGILTRPFADAFTLPWSSYSSPSHFSVISSS